MNKKPVSNRKTLTAKKLRRERKRKPNDFSLFDQKTIFADGKWFISHQKMIVSLKAHVLSDSRFQNGQSFAFVNITNSRNCWKNKFNRSFNWKIGKSVSQRQGECYATTSMRKVELILEFNFLSGSNFLSRLVLQVISVPFVVWINTAVAPRQLFCLMKISLRGFYWSTFRCLAGLANKDCVSSKQGLYKRWRENRK